MQLGDVFKVIGKESKHGFRLGELVLYDGEEDGFPMFVSRDDKFNRWTLWYPDRKKL